MSPSVAAAVDWAVVAADSQRPAPCQSAAFVQGFREQEGCWPLTCSGRSARRALSEKGPSTSLPTRFALCGRPTCNVTPKPRRWWESSRRTGADGGCIVERAGVLAPLSGVTCHRAARYFTTFASWRRGATLSSTTTPSFVHVTKPRLPTRFRVNLDMME